MKRIALGFIAMAAIGCADLEPGEYEALQQEITGGNVSTDSSVLDLDIEPFSGSIKSCTGVTISPTITLTAGHCVNTLLAGSSAPTEKTIPNTVYRYSTFKPNGEVRAAGNDMDVVAIYGIGTGSPGSTISGLGMDMALLHHGTARTGAMRSISTQTTPPAVGTTCRVWGWGSGAKRYADLVLKTFQTDTASYTGSTGFVESGDSGGPISCRVNNSLDWIGVLSGKSGSTAHASNYKGWQQAVRSDMGGQVTVTLGTGSDDNRGGSEIAISFRTASGATPFKVLTTNSLANNTSASFTVTPGVNMLDVIGVELRHKSGNCFACTTDHWNLNSMKISLKSGSKSVLFNLSASPLWRTPKDTSNKVFIDRF